MLVKESRSQDQICLRQQSNHVPERPSASTEMPRLGDREPSVRIGLGYLLYRRAEDRSKGIADKPIFLDTSGPSAIGAGTPSVPSERRSLRHFWMIRASFEEGVKTVAKSRNVHTTPMQAYAYLSRAFEGFDQVRVTLLALNLIRIVEAKDLLRGYSSVCIAGACVVAAQKALDTTLLDEDGVVSVGIAPPAVISAYLKLQMQMYKKLKVIKAIMAASGDPAKFPGKPLRRGKMPSKSMLTVLREKVVARGGSRLRQVENASEIPDPVVNRGRPMQRYYAGLEDQMMFDLEGDSDDEDLAVPVPEAEASVDREDSFESFHDEFVNALGIRLGNLTI